MKQVCATPENDPVRLLLTLDGIHVDPVVEELTTKGARLNSAKHYDRFTYGEALGPAVLALGDEGLPVVYPVVKWKDWPRIGVEFENITEREESVILRFLFKLEQIFNFKGRKAFHSRLS